MSGGNELILRFHWEPLLSQYSCKWKVFKFVVLIKYPWKGMQSWCPNKKALNSKLVSSERRVALLVVTGRTLCFPSRGKEGEGRREGGLLSTTFTTTAYTSRSTAGQAWKSIQFPRFPPLLLLLQCVTLSTWKHLNLCHQNCQLARSHWTFCAVSTQCAFPRAVFASE